MYVQVKRNLGFIEQKSIGVAKRAIQPKVRQKLPNRKIIGRLPTVDLRTNVHCIARSLRVAVFVSYSPFYSGGRIYMAQYAQSLLSMGAEVYFVSSQLPIWASDRNVWDNIRLVTKMELPDDIDIVVSDGKGEYGAKALSYKISHPYSKLILCVFETPNFVATVLPEYSVELHMDVNLYRKGDYFVTLTSIGSANLAEWLGIPGVSSRIFVVNPTIDENSVLLALFEQVSLQRPYVVWCSGSTRYKGWQLVVDTVWELDTPLDLVVIGNSVGTIRDTDLHKLRKYPLCNETVKLALMSQALLVLAPSKFEGYGMVPGESLAVSTPCVVFDLAVLREAYGEVPGLHYVPYGNETKFHTVVRDLLSKPKEVIPKWSAPALADMPKQLKKIPNHRIVSEKSVSVQLIAYWGFCPESIISVYPYVDEILVSFGRIAVAGEVEDGSWEKLLAVPDPDHKIRIERRDLWRDKEEMRSWCNTNASGNHMLVLDGDEIWVGLDKWLDCTDNIMGSPRWVNFWHTSNHWVYGGSKGRWGNKLSPYGSACNHYRWSWWRPSYRLRDHVHPIDTSGHSVFSASSYWAERIPGCVIYHLGHILNSKVMAVKHDMYINRDGTNAEKRSTLVAHKHDWADWSQGVAVDGVVEPVRWNIPDIVTKAVFGISG